MPKKERWFEKNCYFCLVHVKLAGYGNAYEASLEDKDLHPGNSFEAYLRFLIF